MLGRTAVLTILILSLAFTGGLTDPGPRGFVTFSAIERNHFTAFSVWHDRATLAADIVTGAQEALGPRADAGAPLVVHVHVIGDRQTPALAEAATFLAKHLNVVLVHDPRGVPLVLTRENLVATSGPASLGATLSNGMAAEVGNPRLAGCVVAHELGHFLGLPHAEAESDLMYPRCAEDKLETATISAQGRARVAQLNAIRALTPHGIETWAIR